MAEPFSHELGKQVGRVARSLRMGELEHAFCDLEASTDRLYKFITFLSVTVQLLRDAQHPLAREVDAYERRLLGVLERVEGALAKEDFVALTMALEHGVAPVLDRYHGVGTRVAAALRPRLAA